MEEPKTNPKKINMGQEYINKITEILNISNHFINVFYLSFNTIESNLNKLKQNLVKVIIDNDIIGNTSILENIKQETYRLIEIIKVSKIKLLQISKTNINYNLEKYIRLTHIEMYKIYHKRILTFLDQAKIEIAGRLLDLYIMKNLHTNKNKYHIWFNNFKKILMDMKKTLSLFVKDNEIIKKHIETHNGKVKTKITLNMMSYNIRKFIKTYDNIVQININDKKRINVQTLVNKKAKHPHIYNNSINLDYHKIKCRVRVKHNPKSFKPYQYSISIVDRDKVFTNSLEEELCKMGFKVMVFNNTDEAVEKIYQDNTSLILLDANMTTYMGEDFLKMVYDKYDKTPTEIYRLIPVILTSPYIDKTIVNKMLYHKFRDFIIKPFSINDLIKKLVTNLY